MKSVPSVAASRPAWLPALRRALATATGEPVELIETHISCVLLAGDFAYKIKKPVTLPFLDYGSLAARRRCCLEELRVNARWAPGVYHGVSAVTGPAEAPRIDGDGPVLDWVVRMRRFPRGTLFGERLAGGRVGPADIDRLAAQLARWHDDAPIANGDFGTPLRRRSVALAAARSLREHGLKPTVADWLVARADALEGWWAARRAAGRVRECHGDLHLDNVIMLDGALAAFDAIEFDPALRWIDVLDDAAFVAMDLVARARPDLAWRFVNAWLDATGDHAAVPGLRFAMVYRALVRGQAAVLRGDAEAAATYVAAASRIAGDADERLLITHGLPGSGKTHMSQQVLERAHAIRLRSDVVRKRLFGLPALAHTAALGTSVYGAAATRRTYLRLLQLAARALRAGHPVVIDAAFLRRDERRRAARLAARLGVPFAILECRASAALLRERVAARAQQGADASEADQAVLQALLPLDEPLDVSERARAIVVDAEHGVEGAAIVAAWRSFGL